MRPGTLYLVPVPLHEGGVDSIPEGTKAVLAGLRVLIAERAKTARHWLKALCPQVALPEVTVFELDKHRPDLVEDEWLAPALAGQDIGLMSEAGCPGVADPGARVVARAMQLGIPVQALTGPSAILLALMGSGMGGQSFAFQGYLGAKKPDLERDLRNLERSARQQGQTQVFIETPYRNAALLETALRVLMPDTRLGIAAGLGGPDALQLTRSVAAWRKTGVPALDKVPAVFLLGPP